MQDTLVLFSTVHIAINRCCCDSNYAFRCSVNFSSTKWVPSCIEKHSIVIFRVIGTTNYLKGFEVS